MIRTTWIAAQLQPQAPGFWLFLSLVGGILLWSWARTTTTGVRWRLTIARRTLIPYAGLLMGGLSPRLMGLSEQNWLASLGIGVILVAVILALLAVIHYAVGGPTYSHAQAEVWLPTIEGNLPTQPWIRTALGFVGAGAQEFHWSFLRGAIWDSLQSLEHPPHQVAYVAIWAAALVAGLEILVGTLPHRERWIQAALFPTTILIITSVLFLYTRNFWLCWLLHAGAQHVLTGIDRS